MRLFGMRPIALLGAICALSQTAAAQIGECRSIADPAARLACYDKTAAAPAASSAAARPATAMRPQSPTADSSKYVDSISQEDELVNAKLHNICRGC
jgi:hypothetical protein